MRNSTANIAMPRFDKLRKVLTNFDCTVGLSRVPKVPNAEINSGAASAHVWARSRDRKREQSTVAKSAYVVSCQTSAAQIATPAKSAAKHTNLICPVR